MRIDRTPISRVCLVAIAGAALSARVTAQAPGTLRVVVIDDGGTPVGGVTVSATDQRGYSRAERSDANGVVTMRVPASGPLRITSRKPGWEPRDTTIEVVRMEATIRFRIRPIAALDTVVTNESRRVASNTYVLGATEIAASHRNIVDAYDALRDLRPGMLGDHYRNCPSVRNLWVNGRRVLLTPVEDLVPLEGTPGGMRNDGSGRPVLTGVHMASRAPPDSPLGQIKAGHIAEMRYVNCWQRSLVGIGGDNALFITLKAGIGFDRRAGSYIQDSAAARRAGVIP